MISFALSIPFYQQNSSQNNKQQTIEITTGNQPKNKILQLKSCAPLFCAFLVCLNQHRRADNTLPAIWNRTWPGKIQICEGKGE